MIHTAFATRRDGTITRIDDIDASNREDACAKVFARFPPCTLESVCAWPVQSQAKLTLDMLSLRIAPNPICHSAFGTLC
jgi:hypothetical protein